MYFGGMDINMHQASLKILLGLLLSLFLQISPESLDPVAEGTAKDRRRRRRSSVLFHFASW